MSVRSLGSPNLCLRWHVRREKAPPRGIRVKQQLQTLQSQTGLHPTHQGRGSQQWTDMDNDIQCHGYQGQEGGGKWRGSERGLSGASLSSLQLPEMAIQSRRLNQPALPIISPQTSPPICICFPLGKVSLCGESHQPSLAHLPALPCTCPASL